MRFTSVLIFIFCLVSHPAFGAERYISLAPSTTEILYALGLGDRIVGVSTYCNYPPEAKTKPVMGDFSHPNIEKIFSLKPDCVFCTGLEQELVITELKRLKLKVYKADPANLDELYKTISDIGSLTGRTREARSLIDSMKRGVEEIAARARSIPERQRIKVFIEIWQEPMMTAGKGSFVDELIALAGGINIAHDVIRPYCNYSPEKVVEANPGCIIMTYMDAIPASELVKARIGWDRINAVKNNKVFNDINPDLLLRPGPRVTQGIAAIYRKLYQ
ncbi:MAG TPA: cobalamin-binding protein [Candidatus Omnitrophota bacterium]|nr:cobalamin-binding protein [Candidatus Omnitrophota bacterium]